MPSLEQLRNFKASFGNIADEAMVLSQLELPLDDLPLPNAEPVAPPPPPPRAPSSPAEPDEETSFDAVPGDDLTGADELLAEPDANTPPVPDLSIPEPPPRSAAPTPRTPAPAAPIPRAPAPAAPVPGTPAPPAAAPPPRAPAPPAPAAAPFEVPGLGFNFADLLGGGSANLPPPPAVETAIEEALSTTLPEETEPESDISDVGFDEALSDLGVETTAPGEEDIGFDDEFADLGDIPTETAEPPPVGESAPDDIDLNAAFDETGDDDPFSDLGDTATDLPEIDDLDLSAGFPDFDDGAAVSSEEAGTDEAGDAPFPDLGDTV
ncbi:hypothetical protein [Treponema primitia]|uniref:hypothetical protein n=1 Tax=Treponema primitia TaxID=88058 RepID=UPI0002554DC3|nr:hypothetical protein [Treponema primitia]